MWIVSLALRRPYTFIVMALVILLLTPLAILRTPTDIFPEINIPVISVIWNYTGLPADEMAQRITTVSERGMTVSVSDIEHIESQSLNGVSVIKVYFNPGADMGKAMAQLAAMSQTSLRSMPSGATPPVIVAYSASSIPVIQLALSSDKLPEQQVFDLGANFLRSDLATVRGAATPYPYGGKQRAIVVDLDPQKLSAYKLTPSDIVNAVNAQNLALPSGTTKIGELEYPVQLNGTPQAIGELNQMPVRTQDGATLRLGDVAMVRDGSTPQTNIVRRNGARGVLMSIMKIGRASTLDIVNSIKQVVPRAEKKLPPELKIEALFDQSLFVRASIDGVVREALIAALLTALMILLFLGDWRSTLIIACTIPLSIFVSILCLSALGETINIMTLGGLALAVGILVDDATVAIESIDRNLAMGKPLREAIFDGSSQIAVPAFVSTLCICIVFVPMFFLSGVARYLFVPFAEAVVFAMLASYVLSRTLLPTLAMLMMRGHEHKSAGPRTVFGRLQRGFEAGFERFREGYRALLSLVVRRRRAFAACFAAASFASLGVYLLLGQNFFPSVDAGLLRLHVRGRAGLRVEETAKLTDEVERSIRELIPPNEISAVLDNVGLPYSGLNLSYSNSGTISSNDAEIQIALQHGHKPTQDYVDALRRELPQRYPGVEFFFQPADIVSQILNFGLPAPIDVQLRGADVEADYRLAQQIGNRMRRTPGAVDVHVQQMMNAPTLAIDLDRERASQMGLTAREAAQAALISMSGSFQTAPNFWLSKKNGVSYNVVVQTPQREMNSVESLLNTPIAGASGGSQLLGNVASVTPTSSSLVVNHYDVQPVIDVYANVSGRDLGAVARDVDGILGEFQSKLPRGTQLVMRGQAETMRSSYWGLGLGVLGAIVLVYLLIVVNFQSWLDPFIIIATLPTALAGIAWTLLLWRTTLSVPALTGAVLCMGVATANSILMVSFARDAMREGATAVEAAIAAGFARVRPVLMTALAMIIGMIPMSLGLGEGGEQNAPLGRAVIGGLCFATLATLFFVPAFFALLHHAEARPEEPAEEEQA